MWGESEEECAERWRAHYGIERGHCLAEVFKRSASLPMRAYYAKVSYLLSQFLEPRRNQRHLAKAGETQNRLKRPTPATPKFTRGGYHWAQRPAKA
jgi:hypothetical protein